MRRSPDEPFTSELVRNKRVIVCCGAGGVGKTTTAAAIGLAAAMTGRRVLVLTIDPARRLAEAMSIPAGGAKPARVPAALLSGGGELSAWMLDPRVVFEGMVRRMSDSPERADRALSNKLYLALRDLIGGMQEYTAAEALHMFHVSGDYDLVVLDTPPSRNALEFLEAPRKLALFLDEKIIGVFLPHGGGGAGGLFWSRARGLVTSVFDRIFGEGFMGDLGAFLGGFSGMFSAMREHAESVRALLTGESASFLVVTSPDPAARTEARFLEDKLREMHLPFAGYVLNRSWAYTRGLTPPDTAGAPQTPDTASALRKLEALAAHESALAARDRDILQALKNGGQSEATATPHLGAAIEDFAGLTMLAEGLLDAHPDRD